MFWNMSKKKVFSITNYPLLSGKIFWYTGKWRCFCWKIFQLCSAGKEKLCLHTFQICEHEWHQRNQVICSGKGNEWSMIRFMIGAGFLMDKSKQKTFFIFSFNKIFLHVSYIMISGLGNIIFIVFNNISS